METALCAEIVALAPIANDELGMIYKFYEN